TTDDDLYRIGSAFGNVLSHKAIIAAETGLCKGYGFLLYTSRDEAERAIGCLSRMGLQASFAKESFSARLRRMADKGSSNVYLSNLPTDMTTHQLEHLFAPHNVISMRILLNSDGTSRGVGFVRLRDREVAQDCIDRLHGRMLPGCASPLQVRFADSEGQKLLKRNAMMQNSINALNAQARDVLRSSNPLAALDGGRGPGSFMSDLGMPSPSASPFPLSMPAATAAATMASSSPGMYLPYSPTPPMHAQAAHLLNPVTAGAAGLPTPGPSPGDSYAATMAAILAASAAAQQRQAGGLISGAGMASASAYNLSPSPLTAAGTLYGGAGTTTSSLLPSGMMGLASPISGSLSLSRPLSTSNTSTAMTSTMPMPMPMVTYAPTTTGATTSMPEFATFSPPLLNISLGGIPTQTGFSQYSHHSSHSNAAH
ncbi:hypothetical protein OC842_007956, partial [Tilletia horrida]